MFRFIVHKLGLLKHVPFFALWFDAAAMIWNSWFAPEITRTIEKIEEEVSGWEGVSTSLHKFGGIQFNYAGKELGHIHSHGVVDILFSRQIKQTLILEERAEEHHILKNTGWTSFYIRSAADLTGAIDLLALSYKRAVSKEPVISTATSPIAAIGK
jgi:hypothetical protein